MGVQISKVEGNKHLSIREAARRLLRCEISKLVVPEDYSDFAHELILEVSDLQPGNIVDPIIEIKIGKTIVIYDSKNKIVQLGGSEPEQFICWVPGSFELLWGEFCKYARALSEAGYPGCLNCGGRDAGEEWDEMSRRSEMTNIS